VAPYQGTEPLAPAGAGPAHRTLIIVCVLAGIVIVIGIVALVAFT
jgi:hypothetical protein